MKNKNKDLEKLLETIVIAMNVSISAQEVCEVMDILEEKVGRIRWGKYPSRKSMLTDMKKTLKLFN